MKYLPIIALQLLPIVSLYAKIHSFGGEVDSSFYFRNSRSEKRPLVKSVKLKDFERYQWDASVDASFVFPSFYSIYNSNYYGNTYYAYGNGAGYYGYYSNYSGLYANNRSTRLMLRKNETVVNATNIPLRKGAYRAQVYLSGGSLDVTKDSVKFSPGAGNIFLPKKVSTTSLGVAVGYEWQQQMGRFQLFYGYDVTARYNSYSEMGVIRSSSGGKEDALYDYHSFSIGALPMAGVKYYVSSQFSFSIESSYSIAYYTSKGEFSGAVGYGTFGRNYQEKGISYGLTPVSAVNATFHFGQTNP